jgi:two-component system cell cycle response regulator
MKTEEYKDITRIYGINIIVVDRDTTLQKIICDVLEQKGYPVIKKENGEEALAAFNEQIFDIAIIDIDLTGVDGLTLLQKIKDISSNVEVIMMTGHISLDSAVSALRSGAYDYLSKPFDDLSLITSVVGRAAEKIKLKRENIKLIDDLRQSNQELEEVNNVLRDLAIRDGLTGLYNHRYFHEFLAMEIARSPRHEKGFSLIFMDVDDFKHYNDTNGHLEGDNLLRSLAMVLNNRFRKMDLVARYGGEEFVILLPDTEQDEAQCLADEIRQHIEEYPFRNRENQPSGKMTVSIGVSSFPENGKEPITLIKEADEALYKAKQGGKNRVCKAHS